MSEDEPQRALFDRAWQHIDHREFAQAEVVLRNLIEATEGDPTGLWQLYGLLAGVLIGLSRPSEGTEMYRRALAEARRAGDTSAAVGPVRFMLANQHLRFGDPRDALAEAEPVPTASGTFNASFTRSSPRLYRSSAGLTRHELPLSERWTPLRPLIGVPT